MAAHATEPARVALQPVGIGFSYDALRLPGDEAMGLLGVSYYWRMPSRFELGVAGYGAVNGERGGFFTGGVEATQRMRLTQRTDLGVGLYLGGGGGGAAPQGGGLMLRPHLDLRYQWDANNLVGLSWTKVRFPNGAIDSDQLSLTYHHGFDLLLTTPTGQRKTITVDQASVARRSLVIDQTNYLVDNKSHKLNGQSYQEPVRLVGARLEQAISDHGYVAVITHGAFAGGVDGYAQVLAASGWRFPLLPRLDLNAELALGAGGGGAIDTGGGVITLAQLGAQLAVTPALAIAGRAGRMAAPDGDFTATSVSLGLAYEYDALVASGAQRPHAGAQPASHAWRVRGGLGSYLAAEDQRRKNGASNEQPVGLVAVAIDLMQHELWYITGQAGSAISADAGGYSYGLIGLGLRTPLAGSNYLGAEVGVGAAGGGGLAVGHGIVAQPLLFAEHTFANGAFLRATAGGLLAPTGTYQPAVVGLQAGYAFASAYLERPLSGLVPR